MIYKKIHFVGVKGVGMTPLAIIAKEAGCIVTAADIAEVFITDEPLKNAGITPLVGFDAKHIEGVDLVITTGAHGGFDNVEVKAARAQNIPVWTQGQAVGKFMEGDIFERADIEGISVTGTHGKTTTTAMIATLLTKNNLDPTYVIGTGGVTSLPSIGHYGQGKYFVAEADEYATEPTYDKTPKLLWQHPKIAVITNIEHDHPDVYKTVDDVRIAFEKFASNILPEGLLVAYGDHTQVQKLLDSYTGRVVTYGYSEHNMYSLKNVSVAMGATIFTIENKDTLLGEFTVHVPGEHNALNALAAFCVGLEAGLSISQIQEGLLAFYGSKRRSEYVGRLDSGALVYDDYAHHPTEIQKTVHAFKQSYPDRRLVVLFQPHTYSRTKSLFEGFVHAFSEAEEVVLTDIYPSLREDVDPTVSTRLLVTEMSKLQAQVTFLPQLADVVKYLGQKRFGPDTVLLFMGAGDIYKVTESLSFSAE